MTPSFKFYLGTGDINTENPEMHKLTFKYDHKIMSYQNANW
jgi:hypothetical protein